MHAGLADVPLKCTALRTKMLSLTLFLTSPSPTAQCRGLGGEESVKKAEMGDEGGDARGDPRDAEGEGWIERQRRGRVHEGQKPPNKCAYACVDLE